MCWLWSAAPDAGLIWSCVMGLQKAPSASCPARYQLQGFRSLCHWGPGQHQPWNATEVAPIMSCLTKFLPKARTRLQLSSRGAVCRQLTGFEGDSACWACEPSDLVISRLLPDFSILQKYLKSKLKVCAQQHDTGYGFLWTTQVFSWENQCGMFGEKSWIGFYSFSFFSFAV